MLSDGPGSVCRPVTAHRDLAEYERPVRNLVAAGKVWGAVEHRHPWLAYRDIDWDKAWVDAAPAIAAAADDEALAAAVGQMMASLGDPVTRVVATTPPPSDGPSLSWPRKDVLLIDLARIDRSAMEGVRTEIAKAGAVVVDTRGLHGGGMGFFLMSELSASLVDAPVASVGTRGLQHWGYAPNTDSYGMYYSVMELGGSIRIEPRVPLESVPRHVVFVVSPDWLPVHAVALRVAQRAAMVSSESLVDTVPGYEDAVELAPGYVAMIRVDDVVVDGQLPRIEADAVATRDPLARAVAMASRKRLPLKDFARVAAPGPTARKTKSYDSKELPSAEWRALAAIRFWHIMDLYYGYRHLLDQWDSRLPEFVDAAWRADTWDDYVVAMLEMVAAVPDTHSRIWGEPVTRVVGSHRAPFDVRVVQGAVAVTAVRKGEQCVRVGDVVESIDGVPVAAAAARHAPWVSASTPNAHRNRVAARILQGPGDRPMALKLVGGDGESRTCDVQRTEEPTPEVAPRYRLIDGDIGYANLDRLEVADVGPMFEAFAGTKGIVFDMRGYPNRTAWYIAPRLNRRPQPTVAARFHTPVIVADSGAVSRLASEQNIPPFAGSPYEGRVVVLIDDRAVSQAEHTCLFFEAATDVTFVGSPTTGSNGNITDFCLPGGMCGWLTGMEVLHADGRQLQRVGIEPDVFVEPTLAGIRADKDEVLERGVAVLREQIAGRRD